MKQPVLPYGRQWIDDDDIAAVVDCLRGDYLTTGPHIARFEEAIAQAVKAPHAVAVSNGTAALHAACHALGVTCGDEVLVPAITFIASANCAAYLGAKPVFVDVDPDSGLMDVEDAARRVTPKTRAIIPVHLTGRPVDMAAVRRLADAHGLSVIEDGAHALGATYEDTVVGDCQYSDATTFSFHPVKHVTTGEGGAITTRDPELARRMETFRCHGMERAPDRLHNASPGPWYYEQQTLGFNYRITDIQCALGVSQMGKLARFVSRRRALAATYDGLFEQAGWEHIHPIAKTTVTSQSAWHLYSILIDFEALGVSRAQLMAGLRKLGVLTQVHYIPVPWQPFYRSTAADPTDYPGARRYYERTLSLPMFPAMPDDGPERVVTAIGDVLGRV